MTLMTLTIRSHHTSTRMSRLGLIAGNGRFPLLFAEAAKAEGIEIVAVAHQGETQEEIADYIANVTWVRVGELGKIIATFTEAGIHQAVMAGGILKSGALTNIQPDARGMAFISGLPSLKDDVILRGVAQELESEGVTIVASTRLLSGLVPQPGVLTQTAPDPKQWDDIRLGVAVAKEIGRWDIGQSVVVKRGTVFAVEGVEGTNATIRRGGELSGPGTVIVKVSKPQQDLRFDVPTVGRETIREMQLVQAQVLAVEADNTLMLDKSAVVRDADEAGICVVAVSASDAAHETTNAL